MCVSVCGLVVVQGWNEPVCHLRVNCAIAVMGMCLGPQSFVFILRGSGWSGMTRVPFGVELKGEAQCFCFPCLGFGEYNSESWGWVTLSSWLRLFMFLFGSPSVSNYTPGPPLFPCRNMFDVELISVLTGTCFLDEHKRPRLAWQIQKSSGKSSRKTASAVGRWTENNCNYKSPPKPPPPPSVLTARSALTITHLVSWVHPPSQKNIH